MRYASGARGMLWASHVAVGNENGLRLRVYGERGGLEWSQEHPNHLQFTRFGQPMQLLTRGSGSVLPQAAQRATRIPPGHPEGYLEGFATFYAEAAELIRCEDKADHLLPGLCDGLLGMALISSVLASAKTKADGAA